jgi:hypothetical protein
LKSRGQSEAAKAWLVPEYEIDNGTLSENGSGGILVEGNQPPKITSGSRAQTVTMPNTATLTVTATDDGIPKPEGGRDGSRQQQAGPGGGAASAGPAAPPAGAAPAPAVPLDPAIADLSANRKPGIRFRWLEYRGPAGGRVKFDPASSEPVYGTASTVSTRVSFSAPGTYLLRAIASDRQLETVFEVTVTVNGGPSGENR